MRNNPKIGDCKTYIKTNKMMSKYLKANIQPMSPKEYTEED